MEGASRFAEYIGSIEVWSPEREVRQGPGCGVGWLHLDQQIVSTIPAWILLGVEQFGLRQLWSEWDHDIPPVTEPSMCASPKQGWCVHAVPVVLAGQAKGL